MAIDREVERKIKKLESKLESWINRLRTHFSDFKQEAKSAFHDHQVVLDDHETRITAIEDYLKGQKQIKLEEPEESQEPENKLNKNQK